MEKKWVIFRIILIVQLIVAAACLIFSAIQLLKWIARPGDDMIFSLIFVFIIFCISLFDIFCLYLLQNKYPDKELSVGNKALFTILFILILISTLGLSFLFVFGLTETINHPDNNLRGPGIYILISLFIYIPGLVYILINAVKLKRAIKRNVVADVFKTIDEIGLKKSDGF